MCIIHVYILELIIEIQENLQLELIGSRLHVRRNTGTENVKGGDYTDKSDEKSKYTYMWGQKDIIVNQPDGCPIFLQTCFYLQTPSKAIDNHRPLKI